MRLYLAPVRQRNFDLVGGFHDVMIGENVSVSADDDTGTQAGTALGFPIPRIAEEKAKIVAGQAVTLDMLHFLRDWLINHILVSDKHYADEYKKRSGSKSILGKFFKRFW